MTVRLGLEELLARRGVSGNGSVNFNWPAARLAESALRRGEATLAENGALVVRTGAFTGRSPEDKYIVSGPATDSEVWWGNVNHPVTPTVFDQLLTIPWPITVLGAMFPELRNIVPSM